MKMTSKHHLLNFFRWASGCKVTFRPRIGKQCLMVQYLFYLHQEQNGLTLPSASIPVRIRGHSHCRKTYFQRVLHFLINFALHQRVGVEELLVLVKDRHAASFELAALGLRDALLLAAVDK